VEDDAPQTGIERLDPGRRAAPCALSARCNLNHAVSATHSDHGLPPSASVFPAESGNDQGRGPNGGAQTEGYGRETRRNVSDIGAGLFAGAAGRVSRRKQRCESGACNVRFEEWRLDSIWPVDLLARCLTGHRRAGHRIVFTDGCFDVLHRGHVECLQQAASLGDVLVVGVNSDETVRRLKGPDRPVSPAEDRAAVVAAIGCVEYVTIFEDDTPIHLFEAVRPDIYVKGGDHDADTLPERLAVECYGGRVVTVGYLSGRSTAGIIECIRAGAKGSWVPAHQVNHL
jgi:rfaE bifunctional protein nucleotidyltransferase chain/domain